MAHNAIFHQGLHCLEWLKQSSRTEINLCIETLTNNPLKYKQDSSIPSVPLEIIKEIVAFTKALHYDHIYYHTAFSLATYPPTEHMG